jgi:hypothetical protein
MDRTVAELTAEELRELVGEVVEAKLKELLGDPDEGLELRDEFRALLERQRSAVEQGERGEPFDTVAARLGLA